MLVTFTCPAYADITFFSDVAEQLLKLMGQSGKVPGAIQPEDISGALQRLEAAVEADRQAQHPQPNSKDDEDEPEVTLSHLAMPLIELLRAALQDDCYVMWENRG